MKLINLTPINTRATYRLFESLTVTDRRVLKEANGLASDADLEKLLKKISVEIDSNKEPEEVTLDAIKQDASTNGSDVKEGTLNEGLLLTVMLASPTLLKLLGKLVDWVYSKIALSDADKAELKKVQDEYAAAVKAHDKTKQKELEDKVYATNIGKALGKSAKSLHHLFVAPLEKIIYGIGWLRGDEAMKKSAHSVAEVLYVLVMLGVAGVGVYHSLHSMPSVIQAFQDIGLNFDNVAHLVIDTIKGGDMTIEGLKMIFKSVLKKASI
jgi:hypothetical protein